MASSTYVFIAANERRDVFVGIEKSPEFGLWVLRHDPSFEPMGGRFTKLVHLEVFPRTTEAVSRHRKLSRSSKYNLRKLVAESNPDWRDLLPEPVAAGAPTASDISPFDDEDPPSAGGVTALLPVGPKPPRIARFEQPWPDDAR